MFSRQHFLPATAHATVRWRVLTFLALCLTARGAFGQDAPRNSIVPASTLSPDGRYGVTVPRLEASSEDAKANPQNQLIEVPSRRVLTTIHAPVGWNRMNRGGVLPARWSPDGTLLLWEVEGKFSPDALVLVKLADGKEAWQIDLLGTVQQAILIRTRQAAQRRYAAAKRWNRGNGSAYPDGFAVNVRAEGDKARGSLPENVKGKPVSLPLRVHAELTSNPKEIERAGNAQLDAALDGVIDPAGKLVVESFRLRKRPFAGATSDSWLELTDPAAAARAPAEDGDVVSLEGRVATTQGEDGRPIYTLTLDKPLAILASAGASVARVARVRLLGVEACTPTGLNTPDFSRVAGFNADGTLGLAATKESGLVATLTVHSYGFSNP